MTGSKWLSEAVDMNELRPGAMNLVEAPVGSGKTTWALETLSKTVSKPYKMVYLIDTHIGNRQLVEKNDQTEFYSDEWRETVENDLPWFGEAIRGSKVVVMTYAKFGMLAAKYPRFGYDFELILCDEIHNLAKFRFYKDEHGNPNHHVPAQAQLEEIVLKGKQMVIALSATPDRARNWINCPFNTISIDNDVRHLETKRTIPYTSLTQLLNELSTKEKGIVFIEHITGMIEFQKEATAKGFKSICIWSVNNKEHPMTDIQKEAMEHIISKEELPPQYDMVIINASSETGINIYGQVDYMVIHSQKAETQIQVRGRYRKDLDRLYLLDYNTKSIQVPEGFLNTKLFTDGKDALCEALNIRDGNGRVYKWTTVKKRLFDAGYHIEVGREHSKYYAIITRKCQN